MTAVMGHCACGSWICILLCLWQSQGLTPSSWRLTLVCSAASGGGSVLQLRNTNHELEQLGLGVKVCWGLAGLCGTGRRWPAVWPVLLRLGLKVCFQCQDMGCL